MKLRIGIFLTFLASICLRCTCEAHLVPLDKIFGNNMLNALSSSSFGAEGIVFSFKENSKTFTLNGTLMPLSFPSVERRGRIYIDQGDCGCHIYPLLPTARYNYRKIKSIAVDAGHGGEDPGTISKFGKLKEKLLTMDVCLRVEKLLKQRGYKVVLTRTSDRKVPLTERTSIANRAGVDLFVSIHFNSEPSVNATGIETFVLTPANHPSTYQQQQGPIARLTGNRFDDLNIVLGYCLQSSFVKTTMAADRGVKHSRFTVLRELRCPGALVECGFLSNASDSKRIASTSYRNKLAEAIANGIIEFNRMMTK